MIKQGWCYWEYYIGHNYLEYLRSNLYVTCQKMNRKTHEQSCHEEGAEYWYQTVYRFQIKGSIGNNQCHPFLTIASQTTHDIDATLIRRTRSGATRLYIYWRNLLSGTKETNLNKEQEKQSNAQVVLSEVIYLIDFVEVGVRRTIANYRLYHNPRYQRQRVCDIKESLYAYWKDDKAWPES